MITTLDGFFAASAPIEPGDGIVVGFSGGCDSSALLAALGRWCRRHSLDLVAAHLDHALDAGSSRRARAAARIARTLAVPLVSVRIPVASLRRRRESLEEAARRLRYGFLEDVRRSRSARYVATAHHRDDLAETVAMRLLQGTGLGGLESLAARRGNLIRPLLGLSRAEIERWLERQGMRAVDDPTNRDLSRARNLVRHRLLPSLEAESPGLADRLARLADAGRRARRGVDARLTKALRPRRVDGGVEIDRRRLERLSPILHGAALAILQRLAGAERPPSGAASREFARQLASAGDVGCDCGDGWRLESEGARLILRRSPSRTAPFAYTVAVPGEVELPAGGGVVRISRQQVRPWMFELSSRRTGLCLALQDGDRITIRCRRRGDRIRPFGCPYERRVKEVLIDRKVPRRERARLPLLCSGRRVLWIPGVTIDEGCRLRQGQTAWVAEWEQG